MRSIYGRHSALNKRVAWIDTAKGILIILVILGHSDVSNLTRYIINSFDMGAFFMLSGMTVNYETRYGEFLKKRIKGILIPYILFSLIFIIYQIFRIIIMDGGSVTLGGGLLSVIIPVSGRQTMSVYGLWFLPCLFLSELVVYWIFRAQKRGIFGGIMLYMVALALCILIGNITREVSVINIVPIAVFFLMLGKQFKDYNSWKDQKLVVGLISLMVFLGAVWINRAYVDAFVDLSSMTLGMWPLYLISCCAGGLTLFLLSMLMEKVTPIRKIGGDSLYYYGLHYEALGVVTKFVPGGVLQTALVVTILFPVISVYKRIKGVE